MTPERPIVPGENPSQPEKEQRIMKNLPEVIENSETINVTKSALKEYGEDMYGVSVDEDGFLTDEEGEYLEPHSFSKEKFARTGDYFESSRKVLKNYDKRKIHIDNVYGFFNQENNTIVVLDNWSNILDMIQVTETDLKHKTKWETTTEFLDRIFD